MARAASVSLSCTDSARQSGHLRRLAIRSVRASGPSSDGPRAAISTPTTTAAITSQGSHVRANERPLLRATAAAASAAAAHPTARPAASMSSRFWNDAGPIWMAEMIPLGLTT